MESNLFSYLTWDENRVREGFLNKNLPSHLAILATLATLKIKNSVFTQTDDHSHTITQVLLTITIAHYRSDLKYHMDFLTKIRHSSNMG